MEAGATNKNVVNVVNNSTQSCHNLIDKMLVRQEEIRINNKSRCQQDNKKFNNI